ncbi:helix-turn-helix domain-containing protein [Streptococcus agalactiae]|uniref:helix-turn-helix domain-containing protein n=1 Tax=Streptococcus agalactiae TaxID=1311 RepID=UPI001D0167F7|nr:helix-turn-helix transcriptional regulator [Streptococcus agalactiae]
MEKLGDRLRKQRQLNKLAQQELAEILGVKQNTYSDWETGKSEPNNETLIFLSRLFHKSVDYLLGVDVANNIFAERLVELRKKNDLTQQELADRIGINRGAYSNWENGKREPSFSKLIELSKLLNTTPNYLLGISDA